ncbi:Craniofacial development protein 1 [Actinomortierella ambigua]|nr:Craniofacial development protein 1 [Actinomortierella ambigua]
MSKLEDQEFDSDSSEDEDFVPDYADMDSDGGDSDDDDDGDEDETIDEVGEDDQGSVPGKRAKKAASKKKKKGRTKKTSKQQQASPSATTTATATTEEQVAAEQQARKRRIDALWEELNTPSTPQSAMASASAKAAGLQAAISAYAAGHGSTTAQATGATLASSASTGGGKMVTITMTYDFAGEKVTVTKEVPENSKEAKDAAAKGLIKGLPGATPSTGSSSSNADADKASDGQEGASETNKRKKDKNGNDENNGDDDDGPKRIRIRYVRARSRLDDLAALYGVKKPAKLTTLEKSKLDWNSFVGKEGIEDELKHHNKDGYMEKAAFLERTYEHKVQQIKALRRKR